MGKVKSPKRRDIKTSEQIKKPSGLPVQPAKNFAVSYTRTNRKGGRK